MNPEWTREVQQLWAVALNYFESAKALKDDQRTYGDLLTSPDPRILALSADLASAAIRLASLDDLLNGGMDAVRSRAYRGSGTDCLREGYVHVFLRDAVAHAEPVDGVDKVKYVRRQEWLRTQRLADTWKAVDTARGRLKTDIENYCRAARDLDSWMKNELATWLISMKGAQ